MNTISTSATIFACLFAAALFGMFLRKLLPEHHLNSDTQDTVKVAMGLVATMAALVLGLLIAAATTKYDNESAGATEMAAKVIFLDRLLANYGPESNDVRAMLRTMVERIRGQMWPDRSSADTQDRSSADTQLDPSQSHAEPVFAAIQNLKPTNDLQTAFKTQAVSTAFDLGQSRWLEFEQAGSSISRPLLYILTFWLVILFISFGMFAPTNSTVVISLLIAALAVAIAIFLMMELNSPFSGFLQISSAPFDNALGHLGK